MMKLRFACFVCGVLLAIFGLSAASLALMSLVAPTRAEAQMSDLQTIVVESSSKAESSADAARDITASAMMQTAREQAIEALGVERYQKNRVSVESKIVKQAAHFIPFANAADPVKQTDGSWKAKVSLKVSVGSLRKMLSDNGFTGRTGGTLANVLPLIALTDRTRSVSLHWWLGEESGKEQRALVPIERYLHDKLKEEFEKQKIGFVTPPTVASATTLPDVLRTERPSAAEITSIGGFFHTSMIARGDVRILTSKDVSGAAQVTLKIQVVESASPDRIVAEVSREFTTDPLAASMDAGIRAKAGTEFIAFAKDLAAQVQVAWQRGVVGTNYMRLAVRGVLAPSQLALFKTQLVRNVKEIKDVKERLFDRNLVTLEIDYAGDAAQFANRCKSLQLTGFETRFAEVEAAGTSVTVDVRATGAL